MVKSHNRQAVLRLAAAATSSDILGQVRANLQAMSRSHARVAKSLLEDPQAFTQMPLADIAMTAGTSEPTVIRFCRQMGFSGLPDLRISLAMCLARMDRGPDGQAFVEPRVSDKAGVNAQEKRGIARFALNLLGMDRNIILDSGSTMEHFARALRSLSGRTIFTTGLNIAAIVAEESQHTVIQAGGTLRPESHSVSGPLVKRCLAEMNFDTYFLGADSIDLEAGLSTFNEIESQQNRWMMQAARRVVVLADSSKFKAPSLHHICSLKDINVIVTDASLPKSIASRIEDLGVELHRVDTSKIK